MFVKALLEKQEYPHLVDDKRNPITPYDVTAHTLSLLMNTDFVEVKKPFTYRLPNTTAGTSGDSGFGVSHPPTYAIYKSNTPNMDEGWTRWLLTESTFHPDVPRFESIGNRAIQSVDVYIELANPDPSKYIDRSRRAIIFPDQPANQIMNGYAKGTMPDEYTGGVGKEGVENLKKFVENGGTLVFLNRASNFAIQQFNLPVKDVTQGLARRDFYIPGSILRTELDMTHPIAKGMPQQSIAWFENSPAFEIQTDPLASVGSPTVKEGAAGLTRNFRIIATYPKDPKNILLSGWALGAEKIAGKAALVEFNIGKGKIILFGFRPQYRGQSLATFPLLFNAISK